MRASARRAGTGLVIAIVAALGIAGCAPADVGSDPNDPDQVEVFSWWTSGSDRRGFDALTEVFSEQNPGIGFIDASVSGGEPQAREALAVRLAGDNAPDTFLSSTGAGLSEFVEAGQLEDLTAFYDEHGLTDAYSENLLDLLRIDGRIYSVPVRVQRANIVWSNADLLEAAGLSADSGRTTIRYWIDDLEKLQDAGHEYPLALGGGLMQTQLFENVLLADLGPVVYKDLWKNPAAWDAPELATAIADYGDLLGFVDPRSRFEDEIATVHRVVNGDAVCVVVAGNGPAAFAQAATSGHRYSSFPVPGTNGTFDLAAESFTLPVGSAHPDAAKAWLLSAGSADGQAALALTTGSIPARADTGADGYTDYQVASSTSLSGDTVAPSLAYGVAASPSWTAAITDALVAFRDDRRPAALMKLLTAAAQDALG